MTKAIRPNLRKKVKLVKTLANPTLISLVNITAENFTRKARFAMLKIPPKIIDTTASKLEVIIAIATTTPKTITLKSCNSIMSLGVGAFKLGINTILSPKK
ncbi:MAG TPA: hypothetical protein QF720_00595 [Nitrospinota bacterium]|jgi:hypothetical protein|nr:hypothetical protein [Nitrospinota bacterium]|tara:strand:+ start:26995 stop:27297 length:303 start_codon:yes stop_codon:yes gene_type:complete